MAAARTHLSIGEVLSLLREEFPDVTISKIRFLESQGLVDPERTPSGYRKFYDHDVDRLRWILRQQREHFLPLKVIRGRLSEGEVDGDAAAAPADGADPVAVAPELALGEPPAPEAGPVVDPGPDTTPPPAPPAPPAAPPPAPAAPRAPAGDVDAYTLEELAAAAGVAEEAVAELRDFGLLGPATGSGRGAWYDAGALDVVRLSATFARHGVEARHLRAWRTGAEREASVFEQVIVPLLRQRNPHARQQATEILDELSTAGGRLREVLLHRALRDLR